MLRISGFSMLWVNTVNWAGSPTDSSSTKLPVTLLRPSSDNSRLWICKVDHSINTDAEFEYFFLRSFHSLKEGSSRNEASNPASHFLLISAKLHSPQHPPLYLRPPKPNPQPHTLFVEKLSHLFARKRVAKINEQQITSHWVSSNTLWNILLSTAKSNPITGLNSPRGLKEFRAPRLHDNLHVKVVRLSTLRTGHLYPQEIFLVLISVKGWVKPLGHTAAGRIMSTKNSNDTVGNRTRDLPACSAVPQPTALPRTANIFKCRGTKCVNLTKLLRLDFAFNLVTVLCKKLVKWTQELGDCTLAVKFHLKAYLNGDEIFIPTVVIKITLRHMQKKNMRTGLSTNWLVYEHLYDTNCASH